MPLSETQPVPSAPSAEPPLGKLAVSFSGGGYRAAAFHLGALRLLKRMDLLRDVVALSTVSGGSIIGMAWVLSVLDGRDFDDFDQRFSAFLQKTNVIAQALEKIADTRQHGVSIWPSLIRSAADIYARNELFGDRRFGELLDRQVPWRELIFNSTEFRTGLDFRFRRSDNAMARIGTNNLQVPVEVAKKIRLADIVAASSCFPGGFEPLVFPDHLDWPAGYPLDQVYKDLGSSFKGGVALMDGGIYDNQGVESLVMAFETVEQDSVATLVISDVAARQPDMYNQPSPGKRGWLTLHGAAILGWVTFAAALISMGLLAWTAIQELIGGQGWLWTLLRYGVPFAFSAGVVGGLIWLRARMIDVRERLERDVQIEDVWKDVRRLTVEEVVSLVELRLNSMMALTSKVFMKRIRGLVDRIVYRDQKYEDRRMMNLIYGLDQSHPKLYGQYPWLEPGKTMRELARWAEAYPTTLWFNDPADLDRLKRAGEATLCFTLLRFILHLCGGEPKQGAPTHALYERLRQEWAAFNVPAP